MNISATELNKNPGKIIDQALREPIVINKQGRPTVVLVDYEYFTKLEDDYWGKAAKNITEQPEWLSAKESEKFLRR
ncbi:MAG TPA: type II toxin-antitoxin system Phd/YefM family antitoxin [Rickettsia endosymbiont of Bembidion lapponicum]|nr:type II toxin-antitoxin system Phd/YefM family antitoxin [Rickettsia endosymbiont of Bembidion lapponicum]